jgi:class I lanthipeptide synthase
MAECLTGGQLTRITSSDLCHGTAGVYQTAIRAADDALTHAISQRLTALAATLASHSTGPGRPGLLAGDTGIRLVQETSCRAAPPRSGWDACLLIS